MRRIEVQNAHQYRITGIAQASANPVQNRPCDPRFPPVSASANRSNIDAPTKAQV
jgi:hypothetical protein